MKSSVSRELERLSSSYDSKAVGCIKTILSPNLTEDSLLTFRLYHHQSNQQPLTWTSPPFIMDCSFKLMLELEHEYHSSPPSRERTRRLSRSNITVTTTLYLLQKEDTRDYLDKPFHLNKEVYIDASGLQANKKRSSCIKFCTLCNSLVDNGSAYPVEIVKGDHGDMRKLGSLTNLTKTHCLSDMVITLKLGQHIHTS